MHIAIEGSCLFAHHLAHSRQEQLCKSLKGSAEVVCMLPRLITCLFLPSLELNVHLGVWYVHSLIVLLDSLD